MSEKDSKLVQDEEASAAEAEPMGSVAAAVARDEGSSASQLKKTESPKPEKDPKPIRP